MGQAESAKKWFNYPIDPIIRDPIKRRPLYNKYLSLFVDNND